MILNVGAGREVFGDVKVDVAPYAKTISVIADAHYLPFRNDIFGEVRSHNLFKHLRNPFAALSEQKRVLRERDRLVLFTDNSSYWRWHLKLLKLHDISHAKYPYMSKPNRDKHYTLFLKDHLLNFFTELNLKIERVKYETDSPVYMRKLDKIIARFKFLREMAYPRKRILLVKVP